MTKGLDSELWYMGTETSIEVEKVGVWVKMRFWIWKGRKWGGLEVWNSGLGVRGSLITLATSGVCPGNSGFSSVICTSCSSAMVAWQGKETSRLERLPLHPHPLTQMAPLTISSKTKHWEAPRKSEQILPKLSLALTSSETEGSKHN